MSAELLLPLSSSRQRRADSSSPPPAALDRSNVGNASVRISTGGRGGSIRGHYTGIDYNSSNYNSSNGRDHDRPERLQPCDVVGHCGNGVCCENRPPRSAMTFSSIQITLLAAVINHLQRNLKDGDQVLCSMENNEMFKLFFEEQYHRTKVDLARQFQESSRDCSVPHVVSFILSILHQGRFSVPECIISMFYLSRFRKRSKISLHAGVWRPLFLTALLIADKVWQDNPVRNSALTKLFPVLNNAELKRLEYYFIAEIDFDVLVTPRSFRDFCEKLLSERVHPEIRAQVCTSEFIKSLYDKGKPDVPAPLHEDRIWEDCLAELETGSTALPPQLAQSPRAASLTHPAVVTMKSPSRVSTRTALSPNNRNLVSSEVNSSRGSNASQQAPLISLQAAGHIRVGSDEAIRPIVASPSPSRATAGTGSGKNSSFGTPTKSGFVGGALNDSRSKVAVPHQSLSTPPGLKGSLGSSSASIKSTPQTLKSSLGPPGSVKKIFATPTSPSPGSGTRSNVGSARQTIGRAYSPTAVSASSPTKTGTATTGSRAHSPTAVSASSPMKTGIATTSSTLSAAAHTADSQCETAINSPSHSSSVSSVTTRSDPHAMSFQEKQTMFGRRNVQASPSSPIQLKGSFQDALGRPSSAPPGAVANQGHSVRPTPTPGPSPSTVRPTLGKGSAGYPHQQHLQAQRSQRSQSSAASTSIGARTAGSGPKSTAAAIHASCAPPPPAGSTGQVNSSRGSNAGHQFQVRATIGATASSRRPVNTSVSATRATLAGSFQSTPLSPSSPAVHRVPSSVATAMPSAAGAPAPPVNRQPSNALLAHARGRSTSPAFVQDAQGIPATMVAQHSARQPRGVIR